MKHKTLKISILINLTFLVTGLYAQHKIPTTGGDASGLGGSESYTVGQIVYTTDIGTNGSLANGVQQAFEISTTVGIEITYINLELSVYPNPTTNNLTLNVEDENYSLYSYQLYDIQGRILMQNTLESKTTNINMQKLNPSTYILKIVTKNSEIKVFKIIKK